MVLTLIKVTEGKDDSKRLVYIHEFGLDSILSNNSKYLASILQIVSLTRLPEYEVGQHYSFSSNPFVSKSSPKLKEVIAAKKLREGVQ